MTTPAERAGLGRRELLRLLEETEEAAKMIARRLEEVRSNLVAECDRLTERLRVSEAHLKDAVTRLDRPTSRAIDDMMGNEGAAEHEEWSELALPEDDAIAAAHPVRSGRHDLFQEAMRFVGAKRSKFALVDLVNWLLHRIEKAEANAVKYKRRKDEAYEERNRVVAVLVRYAISLGWNAGIGVHEDVPGVDWDPEWRTLVSIDTFEGQASWHVHDSHKHLFEHFPRYEGKWDGHTTPVKYERLERLARSPIPPWSKIGERVLELHESLTRPTSRTIDDMMGNEDDAIAAAFVSAKRSKFALVDLVNWLLHRIEKAEAPNAYAHLSENDTVERATRLQSSLKRATDAMVASVGLMACSCDCHANGPGPGLTPNHCVVCDPNPLNRPIR